jgi:hypothetical protein
VFRFVVIAAEGLQSGAKRARAAREAARCSFFHR